MTPADDRRRRPRWRSVDEHGVIFIRLRPGIDALLADVSSEGALVETAQRLHPGCTIEIHLHFATRCLTVRGRVSRCDVARLSFDRVTYQGAVVFDRELRWTRAGEVSGTAPDSGYGSAGSGWARTTPSNGGSYDEDARFVREN